MSIRKKFISYHLLLVILPLLAASAVIYTTASGIISGKSGDAMFQAFKQTQLRLDEMLETTENLSYKLLASEAVQQLSTDAVEQSLYSVVKYGNQLNLYLFQELRALPYIRAVSLVKLDGTETLYSYGDMTDSGDRLPWEQAVKAKGVPQWIGGDMAYAGGWPSVTLLRAVNGIETFRTLSVLRISLDSRAIKEAYTSGNVTVGAETYILGRDGQSVSIAEPAAAKRQYGNAVDSRLLHKEGFFRTKAGGLDVTAFYYTLNTTGWKVVKVVPTSALNDQQAFLRVLIIVAVSICILFSIVFSVILNFDIIRPIKLLIREMAKVKNGNFDVKVRVRNTDEIGRLSFFFQEMSAEVRRLIDKVYTGQLKEQEAKLAMLSMQINPHFLYNTLDSIRWSAVQHCVPGIADQLEALSNMFRHSLKSGNAFTSVRQEVEHVRNFIMIQNFRFGDRFLLIVEADDGSLDCESPHFVLQPLVENAIQHGFKELEEEERGTIHVRIEHKRDRIEITVEDDGVGTEEDFVTRLLDNVDEASSVALRNIHSRIRIKYGPEYGVRFHSVPGAGTKVTLVFPARAAIPPERRLSDEAVDRG